MLMSYKEYLDITKNEDSRTNWIWWKIECFEMSEKEAIKAAYDSEWGYKPLGIQS